MAYWNQTEIEVEQRIAQERYQAIVSGQQITRIDRKRSGVSYHRAINYLGDKLVTWGQYLKQRYNTPADKPTLESR